MNILIHPTYFPSISSFVAIANAKEIIFEVEDNYQKQTYRNRAYIYGANGKLQLNVPVKHTHKNRNTYKNVKIANEFDWQDLHWKSLKTAYRSSPYFEFFEDEFEPLFTKKHKYLLDLNFETIELISECLQLDLSYNKSEEYIKTPLNTEDFRFLANARKEPEFKFKPYTQVFNNKYGYINNLSILDLLFSEGTNALTYLESQDLTIK